MANGRGSAAVRRQRFGRAAGCPPAPVSAAPLLWPMLAFSGSARCAPPKRPPHTLTISGGPQVLCWQGCKGFRGEWMGRAQFAHIVSQADAIDAPCRRTMCSAVIRAHVCAWQCMPWGCIWQQKVAAPLWIHYLGGLSRASAAQRVERSSDKSAQLPSCLLPGCCVHP